MSYGCDCQDMTPVSYDTVPWYWKGVSRLNWHEICSTKHNTHDTTSERVAFIWNQRGHTSNRSVNQPRNQPSKGFPGMFVLAPTRVSSPPRHPLPLASTDAPKWRLCRRPKPGRAVNTSTVRQIIARSMLHRQHAHSTIAYSNLKANRIRSWLYCVDHFFMVMTLTIDDVVVDDYEHEHHHLLKESAFPRNMVSSGLVNYRGGPMRDQCRLSPKMPFYHFFRMIRHVSTRLVSISMDCFQSDWQENCSTNIPGKLLCWGICTVNTSLVVCVDFATFYGCSTSWTFPE